MASLELRCSNSNCRWIEFTNIEVPECPDCGSIVISTQDEYEDDFYETDDLENEI